MAFKGVDFLTIFQCWQVASLWQIYQILKEQILEEKYLVGDFLPSENDLKEHYQVSRDTIRKSLKLSQEEGFIETVQGMGSQVSRQAHFDFPVSQLTSY